MLEPETELVFEPRPGEVMQGGAFRLVFTGQTFLAFWVENRAGKLRAVVQRLAPTPGPKLDLFDEPEAFEDQMAHRPNAIVEADRIALSWWTSRSVKMAWTDFEGRIIQGPVDVRTFQGPNDHYAAALRSAPDQGYLLFGTKFDDRDDGLRVTRVDAEGALLSFDRVLGVFSSERFDVGALVEDGAGYISSWNTRRPGPESPNEIFTTRLDRDLRPTTPAFVTSAEDLRAGLIWPAGRPAFMATAEYPDRLHFLRIDGAPLRSVEAALWTRLVPETNGRRLGIVYQTGERTASPSTGLPTGVSFGAWDPDTDRLSEPVVLQADDGRCVEEAEGVAAGDRIGVAWVMGCSERRLYFTLVRAR